MKFVMKKFKKLSSTQDKAKYLAGQGAKEGLVVVADTQTKGKGRMNREWVSNKGGLYFSIILRPKKTDELPFLVFKSAIAVCDAINKLSKLDIKLKWPNDVIFKNKKLCGILLESNIASKLNYVIMGIGVNTNNEINNSLTNIATSIKKELNKEISKSLLLKEILKQFNKTIKLTSKKTITEWKKRDGILGSDVKVKIIGRTIHGVALDIDEDFNLLIKQNKRKIKKITVGDVTVIN